MAEITQDLGKVSITVKGAWSSSTAYEILDVVTSGGGSYIAKQAVPAGTALTNTSYWIVLTEKGAKGDTGNTGPQGPTGNGIASISKTGTSGNVDTYTITMSNGDTYTFTVTNGSVTSVDGLTGDVVLDYKANIDGYYAGLTSGTTEQVLSNVKATDAEPYVYRTAGGSLNIGDREEKTIVGGSVVWNQLVQNGNFSDTTNWATAGATLSAASNIGTITKTAGVAAGLGYIRQDIQLIENHIYLFSAEYKCNEYATKIVLFENTSANKIEVADTDWHKYTVIKTSSSTETKTMYVWINIKNVDNDTVLQVRNYVIYDLTQMFPAAIADRAYTMEQSTAGSGVAWLKSYGFFTKPYYVYTALPSLQSVKTLAHETVGFNQWDEEWELGGISNDGNNTVNTDRIRSKNYIPVLPNTTYYFKAPQNIAIRWYNSNKQVILSGNIYGNTTSVSPANAAYLRFYMGNTSYPVTTYNNDICISLYWDGERAGEYEAYNKHSYPLDSSISLNGILKLDANNNIYAYGDRYHNDGTVDRVFGVVDLGTLTWSMSTVTDHNRFQATNLHALVKFATDNIICTKYPLLATHTSNFVSDKVVATSGSTQDNGRLWVWDDSYTDAATFKTAMSGVYLVYELATPTTETADPFQTPMIVDDWGTERFVDAEYEAGNRDFEMPVGHVTKYPINIRAKVETAPDSPNGDGDYIVRQTNGQNAYVPLEIPNELPTAPSEDGTYTLKVTVSGGVATYSWEA